MRRLFTYFLFLFSLNAYPCDHHINQANEFRKYAEAAEKVCAAAAPAVLVLCPFCVVHALVASIASCMAASEFYDEEAKSLRKYENCIRAKAEHEREEREKAWLAEQERLRAEAEKRKEELERIKFFDSLRSSFTGMGMGR